MAGGISSVFKGLMICTAHPMLFWW